MALTVQVAPGVHRVADGIVNWYLVTDGDDVALYDAGWPRSWPRVEAAVRELGRRPATSAPLS
jgi:glyoxylase-like metal-dependent hydrolase (beta-lactamase superfamily II)